MLAAAILLMWSAAGFSAPHPEHRSLFSQAADHCELGIPDSPGQPFDDSNSRPIERGIFQIDAIPDIELTDLQREFLRIPSLTVPHVGISQGIGTGLRNSTLLLHRKKLIYPFHFFF